MSEDPPVIPWTSEKPLFLAHAARAGDPTTPDHDRVGYVTKPYMGMRDEPECVGPAIVDGYTELAQFHQTLRHKQAVEAARVLRPMLKAEDRIRDAERRAKHAHRNLSGEFHVMRKMLERSERGGRRTPPALLERLERVEADLDGVELAA